MRSEVADDPFGILGLSRTASQEELKRAYHKLSMAWHPDRHINSAEAQRHEAERRMKIINAAYVAVGDILRAKQAVQTAATRATVEEQTTPEGRAAAAQRSDAKVEAIRSVVASAALRLIPNLPRYTYKRIVSVVESLLLDTVAVSERAFSGGFEAALREALSLAGLGMDSRADVLKVLDAAADDLQWRGKGADPQTWQTLLRPLEQALHPGHPAKARQAKPMSSSGNLLRSEPLLLMAQGALGVLVILLLIPFVPLDSPVRIAVLLCVVAALGAITFGPHGR